MLVVIVLVVLLLSKYKYEPIDYSIKIGDTKNAKNLVKMLYAPSEPNLDEESNA